MSSRELTCIVCPRGCHLSVDLDTDEVTGNSCPRGAVYGKNEVVNPKRVITSTVRIEGSNLPLCPVKTNEPISKKLMFKAIKELNEVKLVAPIYIGDIIIEDIAGSGVPLVATRDMPRI